MYENLSFFAEKNGWVMQNHGLGINSEKIWAESSTKNTLKYLTTYLANLPNRPNHLG